MQMQLRLLPVILFSLAVLSPLHAQTNSYLAAGKPDAVALLAPPPLPDSPEQATDMQDVVAIHAACSTNDAALAISEKKFFIFSFTPAIGNFFQPGALPKTEAFFQHVQDSIKPATDAAKDYWKRPRPFTVNPSLMPDTPEKDFGYPSGHSTRGTVFALLLAELFPDKRDAILAEGRAIGWHRVQIARHYPTDIYAGRVLARAIVRELKNNLEFQKDLAEVKAENAVAQIVAKN